VEVLPGREVMYRHRAYQQVVYGRFNDFLKTVEELNAVAHKRGWPESSVWTPVVGTGNEAVIEEEYSDLASFAKVSSAVPPTTNSSRWLPNLSPDRHAANDVAA
jgi:hypothetical protein